MDNKKGYLFVEREGPRLFVKRQPVIVGDYAVKGLGRFETNQGVRHSTFVFVVMGNSVPQISFNQPQFTPPPFKIFVSKDGKEFFLTRIGVSNVHSVTVPEILLGVLIK